MRPKSAILPNACFRFFRKPSVRCAAALLMLNGRILESVKKDYAVMREMIYGEYPDYEEILKILQNLENEINEFGDHDHDRP
ncbi:hypothetical protein CSA56_11820 [candidate division KSB3 bacterium]|uniref:Uncharacterized protein n=1 Tax=candidate division KSB3 bacterium TaxID=2044937 RepID=A0A2G6KCF8_9BACT|nr:MAG: hypothetical protein CSA56_11820 [candidate division KSB3 bacterium]